MSWYQDADNSKDLNYTAPRVTEQKLDAGGNYVSVSAVDATSLGTGTKGTLANTDLGGG